MTRLSFTVGLLLAAGLPSIAHADRVVLLPPVGEDAPPEQLDRVEDALHEVILDLGHEVLTERGATRNEDVPPPETANELRAVAEVQQAEWTVVPMVSPGDGPDRYELYLRVGYTPPTRREELRAEVRTEREQERLKDILSAMLRPEGLAEDAARLAGPDDADPGEDDDPAATDSAAEADAEQDDDPQDAEGDARRDEREAQARAQYEEREKQRKREAERRRWEGREHYGEQGRWLLQGGLAIRPILAHAADARGGVLGAAELRVGRSIDAVPGLEARGGLDVTFGASGGFAFHVGGVYLANPFLEPVFLGAGAELGIFQAVTGNRVPSLLLRGGPVFAWHVTDKLYLEASVPEIMYLSANGGAMTIGGSVRAGIRFD